MELALVALGGAIGAVSRFLVQGAIGRIAPTLPLGTLLVNVVGCLAIGLVFPQLDRLPPFVKPLVIVGFLGGLTTMSSYAAEVIMIKESGRTIVALAYGIGGVLACVSAAALGFWLSRAAGTGQG